MTAVPPERREHRYKPAGSAAELFACRDPEVILSGAAGTGKTRGLLEKLHAMMLLTPAPEGCCAARPRSPSPPPHWSPGASTSPWRPSRPASSASTADQQEAASFQYANGSVVVVGGLDKASRIMSSEFDVIVVVEATELTEDDWEALTTRLRNGKTSFQQLMGDCNPDAPHHWLKRRCDRGACRMIYCRHEDNPRLYDADSGTWSTEGAVYVERLDALTGVRRERLRFGRWAAAEGLVYESFDPLVHLSTRFNRNSLPPKDWPRYLAVDFGFTNPFTAQLWVEDPDGRLYMYREIYMTRRLVEDHAKQIAKMLKTHHGAEPAPRAVICDHDAEDRATLERHLGYSTIAAMKDVLPGIEAVQARCARPGTASRACSSATTR